MAIEPVSSNDSAAVAWMAQNSLLVTSVLVCWRLWEKCFLRKNTTLHRPLLSQFVLRDISFQGEAGIEDAKSGLCSREQKLSGRRLRL